MKKRIKIIIDVCMSILLLFLMAYQVTGEKWHEWCGAAMMVLFVVHNILNWRWYIGIFRGKYVMLRVIMTLVNLLCLVCMFCLMFSGIKLSNHVLDWIPLGGSMSTARMLHMSASYLGFVFLSMHLGLHWRMVTNTIKKKSGGNRVVSALLRVIAAAFCAFGIYNFVQARLWRYMFLQDMFVFLDYEKAAVLVLLENLSMMVLWAAVTYYLSLLLSRKRKRVKGGNDNRTDS